MGLAVCFDNLIFFFQMPNGQGRANRHEVYRKGGGGLVTKSCPTLATPWTVACQVPLSMEFPGRNTVVDCHFLLQGYNIVNKVDNMV